MRTLSTTLFALTAGGALASTAHAGGFVLADHGARATGRADSVVATVSDGSAIVHNPAGITHFDGVQIHLGASLVFPKAEFTPEGSTTTTATESPPSVTPQLYVTAKVADQLTVGVGFHTPFGSRIEWPASAPTADEVRTQQLRTYFITPVVGVDLDPWAQGLRVAAGLDLVPADVELSQDLYFGEDVGSATLGGTAFGVGGRIGLQWVPCPVPELSFGLAYRTPVKLAFEGNGDFDAPEPYRSQLPPDGPITTELTLPMQGTVGVAVRPTRALEFEFNAQWTNWSSFERLDIVLPDDSVTTSPRDYHDTVALRVGAEYAPAGKPFAVRAGYMYDPTPVPAKTLTASLPDKNRHDLTVGASYMAKRFYVDAGLLWVMPGDRPTGTEPGEPISKGRFEITALVAALSFGVRFDRE